ncbi:TerB N-terminal domain-containing protein [Hyphomicrobium sp. CS1BSMeth3]|uniref:tellurite resistance TerB family protein n=1 Tax=Hyphomicrobium sp. CS1BSMeth3 TaxID=1892844 RepID=UPI0009FB5FD9|nr:TerB N-terminal domain-containing protein [Hyphomicrobium sp. CS1BSMeth3]
MEGWLAILGIGYLIWRLFGRRKQPLSSRSLPSAEPFVRANPPQPLVPQSRRNRPPQISPRPQRVEWVPAGRPAEVLGFKIPNGLVYVGTPSRRQDGRNTAHILDPSRSISASRPDVEGATMFYWPHFGEISPSARLAQLEWQSTGRRDPKFGIGHVFLFFYGLEYRIFVDKALAELPAIETEVTELLRIYGANYSFSGYAANLLAAIRIMSQRVMSTPDLILDSAASPHIALDFRVALAKRLNEGPLDGQWLLAWYLRYPEKSLRTPATRCFEEFKTLFLARFAEQYPKGLHIRQSSRRLDLQYQSASGAFTKDLSEWARGLFDPLSTTAPMKVAVELALECCDALGAYSRHIGRNPDAAGSIGARVLLPSELRQSLAADPGLQDVKKSLARLLVHDIAHVPLFELLKLTSLPAEPDKRISPAIGARLSDALASLDVGMEPDVRLGGKLPALNAAVTIFNAPGGAKIDPARAELPTARVVVEVAVLAASADGNDEQAGLRSVLADIERLPNLTPAEQLRLSAYVYHLSRQEHAKASGWHRLASRPLGERERIAQVAVGALTADGRIEASEIKFAERLYSALGIPSERLYEDLHKQIGDEPRMVSPADSDGGGVIIPARPRGVSETLPARSNGRSLPIPTDEKHRNTASPERPTAIGAPSLSPGSQQVIVNKKRLRRTRHETAQVRDILNEIYAANDVEAASASTVSVEAEIPRRFHGLDRGHEELVVLFLERDGQVDRIDFENQAQRLGLFTDGALETINDWSFGHFEEVLVEDGNPMMIPPRLLKQLKEMTLPS